MAHSLFDFSVCLLAVAFVAIGSSWDLRDNWMGPTENIWSERQCPSAGNWHGWNWHLEECKEACRRIKGCSAINYGTDNNDCVLRSCGQWVADPTESKDGYKGYYMTPRGNIT